MARQARQGPTEKVEGDPDHLDRHMTEQEAAAFLRVSVRALQNWRVRGGGPAFIGASSRYVRYRRRDLIAWANTRLKAHTSTPPAPTAAPEPGRGRRAKGARRKPQEPRRAPREASGD